jgi:hypothetical protein
MGDVANILQELETLFLRDYNHLQSLEYGLQGLKLAAVVKSTNHRRGGAITFWTPRCGALLRNSFVTRINVRVRMRDLVVK